MPIPSSEPGVSSARTIPPGGGAMDWAWSVAAAKAKMSASNAVIPSTLLPVIPTASERVDPERGEASPSSGRLSIPSPAGSG